MTDLNLVRVKNPLIDIPNSKLFGFVGGADTVDVRYETHASLPSGQFAWTINIPNGQILSRDIKVRVPVRLTFTGVMQTLYSTENLIQTGFDAFKPNPISRMTKTLSIKLNGTNISIDTNETQPILERMFIEEDKNTRTYSTAPSRGDVFQLYEDGDQSIKNPLGGYDDSEYTGRGAFPMTVVSTSTTSTVLDAVITENLRIPPLSFGQESGAGFYNITSLSVQLVLESNFKYLWSHSNTKSTLSNITGEWGKPDLLYTISKPTEDLFDRTIPRVYPYYRSLVYNNQTTTAVAPNGTLRITSGSLQLNSIPSKILIAVERQRTDKNHNTTETFFNINNVRLKIGSNGDVLSNMTEEQLYEMSKNNGYSGSWLDFHGINTVFTNTSSYDQGLIGSVVIIDVGKDIAFGKDFAPGMAINTQLQIIVDTKNVNQSDTITPNLKIIAIYPGSCTIVPGTGDGPSTVTVKDSVFNLEDLRKVDKFSDIKYSQINDIYGGAMVGGNLEEIAKIIQGIVKSGGPLAKMLLGLIPGIGPALSTGVDIVSGLVGEGKKKISDMSKEELIEKLNKKKGGVIIGGKKMNKNVLKKLYSGI